MNTVERVMKNIRQEEMDGIHERTYLLMDAFDSIVDSSIEEYNEEVNVKLNKNLDHRLGYFINEGAKERQKEILVIGGIILVVLGGYKLIKKQICKRKNNKIELKEEA